MTYQTRKTKQLLNRVQINDIVVEAQSQGQIPWLAESLIQGIDPQTSITHSYQYMHLYEANIYGTEWYNVDLSGSNMKEVRGRESSFEQCVMQEVQLHRAALPKSSFLKVDLERVMGIQVNLSGSILHGSHMNTAKFHASIWNNATMIGASALQSSFDFSSMTDMNVSNSRFREASFRSVNATGSIFTSCDFTEVDGSYANFTGCHFDGSCWNGMTLSWANLHGVCLGSDPVAAEHMLRLADTRVVKTCVFSVLSECEPYQRQNIIGYRDLLLQGTDTIPDLFSYLGRIAPLDTVASMEHAELLPRIAVKRFISGLVPIKDVDGMVPSDYTDRPFRLLLSDWITHWLEETKRR